VRAVVLGTTHSLEQQGFCNHDFKAREIKRGTAPEVI
jgi:hypothetical protein